MRATREEETSQRRFYLTIEWTSCSEICSMALINQSESIFYCIAHVDRQIKVSSVWSAVFRAIDLSALLSLFIFDQWFTMKLVRNKIIVCRETCSRLSATARLQTTNSFTLILSWITESRQAAEHWRSDFSLRKNKHTRDILIIHDYSRLFFFVIFTCTIRALVNHQTYSKYHDQIPMSQIIALDQCCWRFDVLRAQLIKAFRAHNRAPFS